MWTGVYWKFAFLSTFSQKKICTCSLKLTLLNLCEPFLPWCLLEPKPLEPCLLHCSWHIGQYLFLVDFIYLQIKPCGIHSLGLPRKFQPLPEIEDMCLSISTQGDRKHQNDEAGVSRNCFLHKNKKLLLRRGIFFRTPEINWRGGAISE